MTTTASPARAARPLDRTALPGLPRANRRSGATDQIRWLVAGLAIAFLIPFVLTDLTSVDRDLYYGVYCAAVFAFVALWLRTTTRSPRAVLQHHWRSGLLLAVAFIAVMVGVVLTETSTSHPGGLAFVGALAWRGVVYGFADGLILSAFPIVAVFLAFSGRRLLDSWHGKAAVGALALATSLLFTAVYHAGYSDFRSAKLRKPLAGDVMWSIPTLATLSPIASPITHAGLHVAAVMHSYDTDTFLPPHEGHAATTGADGRREAQS